MSDKRHTYERYRGGGRAARNRWNRGAKYSPSARRSDRPAGNQHSTGAPDRSYSGPADSRTPARRYGSTNHSRTVADQPQHGQDATAERPTDSPGGYDPGNERAVRREPGGQDHLELPVGGQEPRGQDRQRRPPHQIGSGWEPPVTEEPFHQRYGQPVERKRFDQTWGDRSSQRRSSREGQRQYRSGEHSANRDQEESSGDRKRGQLRDPKTGRFLPNDVTGTTRK